QRPETTPGTGPGSTWEAIKAYRAGKPYEDLCAKALRASHLETILHDDGLGGVNTLCESRAWHDQFVKSPCKRIVRVETVAQDILVKNFSADYQIDKPENAVSRFFLPFLAELHTAGRDPDVVGFKSVVCYRTGLAVKPLSNGLIAAIAASDLATLAEIFIEFLPSSDLDVSNSLAQLFDEYCNQGKAGLKPSVRVAHKPLNDYIVGLTMVVAGVYGKPVQFHTGLGDSEITLALSSPAHLQPLIVAHPQTQVVLLHSSYPYTRDAGYLCSAYANVWLDFGEVFAMISTEGSRDVIRQILEVAPTNKIMWSSDGHWWPESFYLGSLLAREALLDVLTSSIRTSRLPVSAAINIARNALFHTANRVYNLGLPDPDFQL
ncbi:amidohydrolase-domain-containing protein, partial [Amylostereum chailletii]